MLWTLVVCLCACTNPRRINPADYPDIVAGQGTEYKWKLMVLESIKGRVRAGETVTLIKAPDDPCKGPLPPFKPGEWYVLFGRQTAAGYVIRRCAIVLEEKK